MTSRYFLGLLGQEPVQPGQPHPQPPDLRVLTVRRTASTITAARATMSSTSMSFMSAPPHAMPSSSPTTRTISAVTQAMQHCPSTTLTAQRRPSSRLTEATAATQGV